MFPQCYVSLISKLTYGFILVDPQMPTLSPHPPLSNDPGGGSGSIGLACAAMALTPATPSESHDMTPTKVEPGPKSTSSQVLSPSPLLEDIKTEPGGCEVNQWKPPPVLTSSTPTTSPKHEPPSLKRPHLPAKEYEVLLDEEETSSGNLYDYSPVEIW